MEDKVKLSFDGKDFEFPVLKGSENEKAFDVFKERQRSTFSEKNGRWQMAVRENNRKYHE